MGPIKSLKPIGIKIKPMIKSMNMFTEKEETF